MRRSDLPRPTFQYVIDYNGADAIRSVGQQVRKYPRLLPVPYLAFSQDSDRLAVQAWRRNVRVFPQLYVVVSRDVEVGEGDGAKDAVMGYGLALAVHDDAILQASPDPEPRDSAICHWYSLYSDGSQVLGDELLPLRSVADINLTMTSPTLGTTDYPQAELLFDGGQVLAEMSTLNCFGKGEWIALGAVRAPVAVPFDRKFGPGEEVTIEGGVLGRLTIAVDDSRTHSSTVPTWRPRPFAQRP